MSENIESIKDMSIEKLEQYLKQELEGITDEELQVEIEAYIQLEGLLKDNAREDALKGLANKIFKEAAE